VDEFGNLPDAIERAGRLGGIKGKVKAVYAEKEGFSLLRLLLGQETEESLSNLSLPYRNRRFCRRGLSKARRPAAPRPTPSPWQALAGSWKPARPRPWNPPET